MIPCLSDFCSEPELVDIAKSMRETGLLAMGYNYIMLDDCWAAKNRSADGRIVADPSRFPSGMANFTAVLHGMGFKLGLYSDVGPSTCRGGRLGSWPHYAQDARTFALEWQIDAVKMDWCHHPQGYSQQQLYSNFSSALAATGRDMFFTICGWGLESPGTWAPRVANAWRTGPDHIPVWYLKNGTQDPGNSGGTSNIILQMRGLSGQAGPRRFNDPDFLEIEPYTSEREVETQLSFWALFAAPFVVATDPRRSHVRLPLLNAELVAIDQDPLVQAGDLRIDGAGQIWSRPLSGGGRWAVVAYNPRINFWDGSIDMVVPLDGSVLVGLTGTGQTFSIRNVWRHRDEGTATGSFKVGRLGPRESVLLVITQK